MLVSLASRTPSGFTCEARGQQSQASTRGTGFADEVRETSKFRQCWQCILSTASTTSTNNSPYKAVKGNINKVDRNVDLANFLVFVHSCLPTHTTFTTSTKPPSDFVRAKPKVRGSIHKLPFPPKRSRLGKNRRSIDNTFRRHPDLNWG